MGVNKNKILLALDGGFHNSPRTTVWVKQMDYEDYQLGRISFRNCLTLNQQRRLDRHFCGVKNCTCGGLDRANVVCTNIV